MSLEGRYVFESLDAGDVLQRPDVETAWQNLLQSAAPINGLFRSPDWVRHLQQTNGGAVSVRTVRDATQELVGVVPLRSGSYPLTYELYSRRLWQQRLRAWRLLGSLPMLPDDDQLHEELILSIAADGTEHDGIYADTIPTDSVFWRVLCNSRALQSDTLIHVVNGPRPWHLLELQASFDDYLATRSSKSRSTLRRRVRRLRDAGQGRLEIERIERAEQVADFLREAKVVSRSTWQHRVLGQRVQDDTGTQAAFADLADRGVLRCYLLRCGDQPIAFLIGYQFQGVYHSAELGFDPSYQQYSPGTVLLFLLIEDLHSHRAPQILNFGLGDATYKRRFGTLQKEDVSCLILRRTVRNRVTTGGHAAFQNAVQAARRLVRRQVPD